MVRWLWLARRRARRDGKKKGVVNVAKKQKSIDDLARIVQLLQSLLAIELWRGGLKQAQIAKRLSLGTNTVNEMLKGVGRQVLTIVEHEE